MPPPKLIRKKKGKPASGLPLGLEAWQLAVAGLLLLVAFTFSGGSDDVVASRAAAPSPPPPAASPVIADADKEEVGPGDTDITYLIRSENVGHDLKLAAELKATLVAAGAAPQAVQDLGAITKRWKKYEHLGNKNPLGAPFHIDYWTVLPWLVKLPLDGVRFVVVLDSSTKVDVRSLRATLQELGADTAAPLFVGHGLKESKGTVIHEYDSSYVWPHHKSGYAFNAKLIELLQAHAKTTPLPVDTNIDSHWQLNKYVAENAKTKLVSDKRFCAAKGDGCATWPSPKGVYRADNGLKPADVIIGVKSCKMFHKDRLGTIAATWGKDSPIELVYLSDAAEDAPESPVPTVDLTKEWGEVVNQKKGHCAKMDAILKHFEKHYADRKWFVVADDDTLFNTAELFAVLNSHDHSEPIYLGERYGYAHTGRGEGTYDYVTTGGGMAMSIEALKRRNKCARDGKCDCASPDTYDDMQLGRWMASLSIPAIHEEGFHQAAPSTYTKKTLADQDLLSFHKFENGPDNRADIPKTAAVYNAAFANSRKW